MTNALISALLTGKFFPHPVNDVELIETHISWIILTGEFAYKIKKPVNFGFLDFTSLEQRKQYCEAELSLNRRAAPQIYDSLIAISGDAESPKLGDDTNPFEYAICMHQFEQDQLFGKLAENNALTFSHIDALSYQVARFHDNIDTAPETSRYGQPEQVYEPMLQNFEQITSLLEDPVLLEQIKYLQAWTESSYKRLLPCLEKRRADGKVREGHGDMHLGNIAVYKNEVLLFDCIEFNEDFRWIDTISDIAFLVMDCETHGLSAYANRFLNTYLEESGDYEGLKLLLFYKVYRAIVRAKIALLTLQNDSLEEARKTALMEEYRRYADLAERYIQLPSRFVLTMHGISGTGKSTVAQRLVDELGAIRIRSDAERKRLYGLNIHQHPNAELSARMYSDSATHETYEKLARLCEYVLDAGLSVIIDATNLKKWQRETIQDVADSRGVPLCIAYCQASMTLIREWIQKRTSEDYDPSDANLDIANQQMQSRDSLSIEEMEHTFVIHSDILQETQELAQEIKRRYLMMHADTGHTP